jgi:hypothetical protein
VKRLHHVLVPLPGPIHGGFPQFLDDRIGATGYSMGAVDYVVRAVDLRKNLLETESFVIYSRIGRTSARCTARCELLSLL